MKQDDLEGRLAGIPLRRPPSAMKTSTLDAIGKPTLLDQVLRLIGRVEHLPVPWSALAAATAACLVLEATSVWIAPDANPAPDVRPESFAPRSTITRGPQRAEWVALLGADDSDGSEGPSPLPSPSPSPSSFESQAPPKPRSQSQPNSESNRDLAVIVVA